jgi:MFS-type transporter involved in bile tolerance (Atg22 family)
VTFRGIVVFAGAFAAMLCAGALLAINELGTRESIRMLWVSSGLSVVAILGAIAAVLLARR